MKFGLNKPDNVAGSAAPAIAIGCFVAFGGVLFGYDTGTIGGILAMPFWLQTFSTGAAVSATGGPAITAGQSSQIVSILSAGTFFGALGSAPLGDQLGRRLGLIAFTFVFIFGVILQTAATAIPLFTAGRFFAGFGVGLISALIPLYQSECLPKWIRGSVVGCYQFAITVGLFIAAIVDYATHDRNDTGSYRIPIAIQFAWALIMITGMLILPETPRYHIKRGRHGQALKSLSRLRRLDINHPGIIEEIGEIQANHEYELSLDLHTKRPTFPPPPPDPVSGISNAFIITVITDVVNVTSTIPGLYFVEKWGRRPLLLYGAIGMFVCQYIVAITGTADPNGAVANKVLIAFVCFYIFFFASTWGPIAWVVTGEIFPLKARAKCLSMTTATNWLLNFAIGYMTPYLVNSGPGNANLQSKVFFIWGGFCLICAFFVWGLIYETKGLSLEQVDELYAKESKAWRSARFVPTVSFAEVQDMGHDAMRSQSLADVEAGALRKKSVVQVGTDGLAGLAEKY
ncbi:High-affinity glucose transporter rgt2 [Lambiella insularis]|nr:High-affinity glucose transporter rgt2 [Lambiella insularis]